VFRVRHPGHDAGIETSEAGLVPEKQIFRKVALERLSSPEQLDIVMQVTTPQSWIALGAVGVLALTLIAWGLVGSIPDKVPTTGILLKRTGIFEVVAPGTGSVEDLSVKEGDQVSAGQVLAHISQPDLKIQISNLKSQLSEMQAQHTQLTSYRGRDGALRADTAAIQKKKLEDSLRFLNDKGKATKEQLADVQRLLERGLVTKQKVMQVQEEYFANQDQIQSAESELRQLELRRLSGDAEGRSSLENSRTRIAETERQIQQLEGQLDSASVVRTPFAGRILEMKADSGQLVGRGAALFSMQIDDESSHELQVVAYVTPGSGKSIQPGMLAQVSPSTAKREEYGFLVGRVTHVSAFPSTREGMKRVLANDSLVSALSGEGAPFAVSIDLLPDASTASGYQWSSTKGARQGVAAGTLCGATIVVRDRRPISMVIPLFREYTGL
jgi:HlyD family secretion protein